MPTLHIDLSEPALAAIANVAQAHGQTVEAFVAEAAERVAEEEAPIRLTPEQIAICEQAEAQFDAGNFVTLEEFKERLATQRAAWIESQKP